MFEFVITRDTAIQFTFTPSGNVPLVFRSPLKGLRCLDELGALLPLRYIGFINAVRKLI